MAVCNEHIIYQSPNTPLRGTFSRSKQMWSLHCIWKQL